MCIFREPKKQVERGERGEKEREGVKKEKEGAKQPVLWLPRFTNFWLSNHINQEAEKETQSFWLPRFTAFLAPKTRKLVSQKRGG